MEPYDRRNLNVEFIKRSRTVLYEGGNRITKTNKHTKRVYEVNKERVAQSSGRDGVNSPPRDSMSGQSTPSSNRRSSIDAADVARMGMQRQYQRLIRTPVLGAIYSCDECEATYRAQSSLRRHINETHRLVGRVSCDACGREFERRYARDLHSCPADPDRGTKFVKSDKQELRTTTDRGDKILISEESIETKTQVDRLTRL